MTLALDLQGIRKTYANGTQAIDNIDLSIESGDFCALLGPNGAGKSTLIGMISSLVNRSHGTIKINGFDLDTQTAQAKMQIGVMPQEYNLSHFENPLQILTQQAGFFGIPYRQGRKKALELLERMQLLEHQKKQVRMLSGGMKRRLMVARALVHSPKIIILDEPTAGVDIEIREELWRILDQLHHQGLTVILATHYLEEAEARCISSAVIKQGKIILHDTMPNVLSQLSTQSITLETVLPIKILPKLKGYSLKKINAYQMEANLSRQQSLTALIKELLKHNIEIKTMGNAKTRLEQLFTHLVNGKHHD